MNASSLPATPAKQWAAIATHDRGGWIVPWTVRRTKREARIAYLGAYEPAYHVTALRRVRFARVVITEAQCSTRKPGA